MPQGVLFISNNVPKYVDLTTTDSSKLSLRYVRKRGWCLNSGRAPKIQKNNVPTKGNKRKTNDHNARESFKADTDPTLVHSRYLFNKGNLGWSF